MPELKRTFTGGRMEKDLDERILPNGQYREALNIGVATSEDSDVGAAQNVLGNTKVTFAASSTTYNKETRSFGDEHVGYNQHIAEIIDPQTDMLYRFVHTPNSNFGLWVDRIIEYDTSLNLKTPWPLKEHAIMVDVFKVTTQIVAHSCICIGSNKSEITVPLNKVNYLRWGMLVTVKGQSPHEGIMADEGVTIENINYTTGVLSLSKPVFTTLNPPNPPICNDNTGVGDEITFTGDRNLNFSPDNAITGINIIDGMIFWTDNFSEPKKVNIRRGKIGSISESNRSFDGVSGKDIGRLNQDKIDDFNQHTLLIVDDGLKEDCLKDEAFCPIVGCTDPTAFNFDPLALYDDGSCCLLGGCTDDSFIVDANGLMPGDAGYIETQYCNYDEDACYDDGSCAVGACGCTDPLAQNYLPTAIVDDGTCVYCGCMDPLAVNYDAAAVCDDGSCQYNYACVVAGYTVDSCTDPSQFISATNTGNTNMFDEDNWFDETFGDNFRHVMNWFSETANANKDYIDHYFMWLQPANAAAYAGWSSGYTTNLVCDYDIDQTQYPNQYLLKLILNQMFTMGSTSGNGGLFTRVNATDNPGWAAANGGASFTSETSEQQTLGNSTVVSMDYNPGRTIRISPGYGGGAILQPDPWDSTNPNPGWGADIGISNHYELVEALRSTIFDGTFNCFESTNMVNIVPVPEITHSMTFQQVYDIAYAVNMPNNKYFFGNKGGNACSFRVLPDNCDCSGTYSGNVASCQPDPNGQYQSLTDCQNFCGNTPTPL